MRADRPASMQASGSRPIWRQKRGFVYAIWARVIASLASPNSPNFDAMETALRQSPISAAARSLLSFVSMGRTHIEERPEKSSPIGFKNAS